MRRDLAFQFSRVTEAAALAGYKWLGRGDKNIADGAAVEAMREMLNTLEIEGEIVIGEGEIDEAPMLYIGEKVGIGGDAVDIAVDPIEGTRMTAMGQSNAIAVLAAGAKGSFLKAPDMYMEKVVVGPQAKGVIDIDLSFEENVLLVAKALNKPVSELTVVTLAKPRHDSVIKKLHDIGAKVFALPDGDVAASILTCMPESDVDMMYCVGGAPEGVISAAVIRALGGDMQARLMLRNEAKGDSEENLKAAEWEKERCAEMDVVPGVKLRLEDMCSSDDLVFSATGITKGDLLEGASSKNGVATTETLMVRGRSRTIRKIKSTHYLDRKDDGLKKIIL
jgi:fructose-1,6-bisphosphatase II